MKKAIFTLVFFLCAKSLLYSQSAIPEFNSYHKNVYAEFLGTSLLAGINYDMRLKKGRMDGIGFRVGMGGGSVSSNLENTNLRAGIVAFPLEFNHLVGKKRSSFISGVGLLPVYVTVSAKGQLTDNKYVMKEGFGLGGAFLTMGYRFQPIKTGVMFQITWDPMLIRGYGFSIGNLGVGIGVGFK